MAKSKAVYGIGQFVATLGALLLAMKYLGVATQEDIHRLELSLVQARARVDVIATVYQTKEGITIFWDTLEPANASLAETPSGPPLPEGYAQ